MHTPMLRLPQILEKTWYRKLASIQYNTIKMMYVRKKGEKAINGHQFT